MYGPLKDVPGECNAHLYIGDDYGDNSATIRCSREPNHEGKHRETFTRKGKHSAGEVIIEWENDEREPPQEPTEG